MSKGRSRMALHSGEPPCTLSHWSKWRSDAGVKGKQMIKNTQGIDERKRLKVHDGYAWSLEGERYCDICGIDILKGQQAVHPVFLNLDQVKTEFSITSAFHPRCITPEIWDMLLGPPMAGSKRATDTPSVTDKTVRQAIEEGVVQLDPGVSVEEAVDQLRALRGQRPISRTD